MMTFVNVASLVFWVPILAWYVWSGQFPVLTSASIIGLLYMALGAGVACVFLSFYAVKIIGATATTVGLFIQPLVGAVVGVFVMDDAITASLVSGAIIVMIAISLSVVASRQSEVPA
jgi:drug/metabolite transporter (DMT)-like permease